MEGPSFVIDAKGSTGPVSLTRWRLWVSVYGPLCASWLVKRFRASIKTSGGFDVFVPRAVSLVINNPKFRWFKLAHALLRQRPSWRVRERTTPTGTTFEFRWLLSKHATHERQ